MRELSFSGENRNRDLLRLKQLFDEVAAEAQSAQAGTDLTEPIHRVALVHAERGLGKTRLVMELYRYLSTSCDPKRYWPDDYHRLLERMAVMPSSDNFDFNGAPNFLWWGLAISDGPNAGSTIFNGLEDLLPHLTATQLAKRRRNRRDDAVLESGDFIVDVGLEIADLGLEIAGEVVGVGALKRVGQAIFKIGSIVKKHVGDDDLPMDAAQKQVDTVVDSVLHDLTSLFAPRSHGFAGIPLVILVDDAQFADNDQAMAKFLEVLIARSAQERWPLLLVLTHWSRQLRRSQNADGIEQPRSQVADVLNHAHSQTEVDLGRFAEQPGGLLSKDHFEEIDIGEPVDDLNPALTAQFPGIEPEKIAAIVEKSGGNPRKLEQIVMRMDRKPAWFEDPAITKDLTDQGYEQVLSLSDLPIDEIVLERFCDTPPKTRRAMTLASFLGTRFLVDLVDRLAEARFADTARVGLEEGETRYRFLRDVVDRSRNDVASFGERLFVEAAEEYRRSGLADAHLEDWSGETEIYETLDSLLTELVEDPSQFGDLNDDDLVEGLSFAASRMMTTGSPNAGLAFAYLVHVENRRGNPEGAYFAAAQFIEGFGP